MLTGKRFTLESSTMAVDTDSGKRKAVTIPASSVIKVVSLPRSGDPMVEVLWEGRVVLMFIVDVEERGTEIMEK
jgi:hypothetical protein